MDNEKLVENVVEKVTEAMTNSKKFFLCQNCKHKVVCKKIEDEEDQCKDYLSAETYKMYASIYSMFQPIFDWLKFHYPSGEVKFVVDRTSAKMCLEHGPAVFSKELGEFGFAPAMPMKDTVEKIEL